MNFNSRSLVARLQPDEPEDKPRSRTVDEQSVGPRRPHLVEVGDEPGAGLRPVVALVDPRAITRDSLGAWLAGTLSDYEVRVAAEVDEAIAHSVEARLAIVICHIGSQRVTSPAAADTLSRLVEALPATPIAVLADDEDLEAIMGALRAGARGYLPTNLRPAVVGEAVRLICAGETYAPTATLLRELEPARSAAEPQRVATVTCHFSSRQLQIIECLHRGIPNKCIAYELAMSQGTVKVHIRNIMKKLGAQNRTQVVIMTSGLPGLQEVANGRESAAPAASHSGCDVLYA